MIDWLSDSLIGLLFVRGSFHNSNNLKFDFKLPVQIQHQNLKRSSLLHYKIDFTHLFLSPKTQPKRLPPTIRIIIIKSKRIHGLLPLRILRLNFSTNYKLHSRIVCAYTASMAIMKTTSSKLRRIFQRSQFCRN